MLPFRYKMRQRGDRRDQMPAGQRDLRRRTKDDAEIRSVQSLPVQGRLERTTGQQGLLLHDGLRPRSEILVRNEARMSANLQGRRLLSGRLGLSDIRCPEPAGSGRR